MQGSLEYPFSTAPKFGEAMEVRPGLHWIRMPVPVVGLQHINLWLIDDGPEGWTLVDTGVGDEETRRLWRALLGSMLGGRPLRRVICTHFHADHSGQAGWFATEYNAPLWMSFGEWTFGRMLSLDISDTAPEEVLDFYRRIGFGGELLETRRRQGENRFRSGYGMPRGFRRISGGERLRMGGTEWQVMIGQGHSPEHACLWSPACGLLIAGDQVLPRISPHIGVYPTEPDADPLRLYLASLPQFRALPTDTLVLPSHGLPFRGLAERVGQLERHHEARLIALEQACAEPQGVLDVLPVLFRRQLDESSLFMAAAEALAHLHLLIGKGRLSRSLGTDGIYRYRQRLADAA